MPPLRLVVGLLSLWLTACGVQYDLRPTFAASRTYEETTEIRIETTGANVGPRAEHLRWVVERTFLHGGRYGQAPLAWLERVSRVVVGEQGRRIMHWDSGSGLPPPEEYAAYAALCSLNAEIQVTPQGEVTVAGMHFRTDAMERSGWNESVLAMVKRSVDRDRLARAAQDFVRRVPPRPVRMNETWARDWALLSIGARWTWQLIAVSADTARFRIAGAVPSSVGLEVRRATGEAEVELASGMIRKLQLGVTIRQVLGDVVLEHKGSLSMTARLR